MRLQDKGHLHKNMNSGYQSVIRANQELHSVLAASYDASEPHFRPENVAHVEGRLKELFAATSAKRMLDLGCGTGFLINIAKKYLAEIDGVDITEAMLSRVDQSGGCNIRLHLADTGSVSLEQEAFDVVTAYSFLHHLYDIGPTLRTAARALRRGGKFYADLEPNYYFWEAVKALDRAGNYHPLLEREILSVTKKDEEIQERFHVDKQTFNEAEYNKNIAGGFRETELTAQLLSAGFAHVDIFYYWYLGQSSMVNDPALSPEQRVSTAGLFASTLEMGLPLTRMLFKYVGFVATR
jgi:ubiquinone/menaquinone biosynthesis C-methylase UbiE